MQPIASAVAQQGIQRSGHRGYDPMIGDSLYGDREGHWARLLTRTGIDWIIPPALELAVGPVGAKRQAELVYLGETGDALSTLYQRLQRTEVPAAQKFVGERLGLSQNTVSANIRQRIAVPNLRAAAWSVLVTDLLDSRGW